MDKTDRLRDYGLAFLLYEQGLGIYGYELIRELFIFIKLILNSYLFLLLKYSFLISSALVISFSGVFWVFLTMPCVAILSTPLLACWCPSCFELWYKDNDLFPSGDTKFGFSSNQISFLTLSRLDSIRYAIYSFFYFPKFEIQK